MVGDEEEVEGGAHPWGSSSSGEARRHTPHPKLSPAHQAVGPNSGSSRPCRDAPWRGPWATAWQQPPRPHRRWWPWRCRWLAAGRPLLSEAGGGGSDAPEALQLLLRLLHLNLMLLLLLLLLCSCSAVQVGEGRSAAAAPKAGKAGRRGGGERTCSSGGVTSVFMALRMLCTRQESLESSRLGGRLIENPTPAPFLLAGLTLIFNEHQSSSPLYISDVIAVPQCMMDQRAFSEYLHFSLNPLNAAPVQSCRTDLQRLSAEP